MEPIRPQVDAFLLDWVRRVPLHRKWFFEQGDGNCRLTAEFAVELSETSRLWKQALDPFAESVVQTLWTTTSRPYRAKTPATRLTQRRKREAKGISTSPPFTPLISRGDALAVPNPVRSNAPDPIARARRGEAQRRQAAALKAWNPTEKPNWLDKRFYRDKIQPRLPEFAVQTIMSTLAVLRPYATRIRGCQCIPHPRHWFSLARAVGVLRS
jgi:hypothetical protein